MSGPKLRYSSEKHAQGLNSSSRLDSRGRSKSFLYCTVITAALIGGPMSVPAMKKAAAQEKQVDVGERIGKQYRQFRNQFADRFTAIRRIFAKRKRMQMVGPTLGKADRAAISALMKTLDNLNKAWAPYNNNKPIVPLEGKTISEKFRSLTKMLGRTGKKAEFLDPAALGALEQHIYLELSKVHSIVAAEQAAVALPKVASPVVAEVPKPPIVPRRTVPPVVTEEKPKEVPVPVEKPAAPAVDKERAHYQEIIANLDSVMEAKEATKKQKDSAKWHRNKLNKRLKRKKLNKRQKKALERIAERAESWADNNIRKIQERALAAAPAIAKIPLARAASHPLKRELDQLLTSLQGISGHDILKNRIINMLPDVWLVGEAKMQQTVGYLTEARNALQQGREGQAEGKFGEAENVFTSEQAMYKHFISRIIIPITDNSINAIKRSQMQAGKRELEDAMNKRLVRAREIAGRNKVSYQEVADLYQSVISDDQVVSMLIATWDYCIKHGFNSLNIGDKTEVLDYLTTAARSVADPKFDPWSTRKKERRKAAAALQLHLRGVTNPTKAQIASAERYIIPLLKHSTKFRYDDALYGAYLAAAKVAPALPIRAQPLVESVARLHSLRVLYRPEYAKYTGPEMILVGAGEYIPVNLHEPKRLEIARSFLTKAIERVTETLPKKESDMRESDKHIKKNIEYAKTLLKATKQVEPDNIPIESDRLYHAAMSLTSTREAQLVLRNRSLRRRLSAAELKRVGTLTRLATETYKWNFSVPKVYPAYHFNIATHLADTAIEIMAPGVMKLTEASTMYASITAYKQPMFVGVIPADMNNPTTAEREKAATKVYETYLAFLTSLRREPAFGLSAATRTLNNLQVSSFGLLDPRVSRTPSPTELTGFPILGKLSGIRFRTTDNPVDQHRVRGGAQTGSDSPVFEDQTHEDLTLSQWGHVYMELYKQTFIKGTTHTPTLLRQLDVSAFQAKMRKLGEDYANRTPAQQLQEGNKILLDILDARIKELKQRLGGARSDGIPIRDLAESDDPKAYYVKRALEMYEVVGYLSETFHKLEGQDLFIGRANPRQAIAIAEMAIASLTDENITGIPIAREVVVLRAHIPEDPDIRYKLDVEGDPIRHEVRRIIGMDVHIQKRDKPKTRRQMPLAQYVKKHGKQDILCNWFVFQKVGGEWHLYNPNHNLNIPKEERLKNKHLGVYMENATVVDMDGNEIEGNFFVRTKLPEVGEEGKPVLRKDGKVDIVEVLLQVKEVTRGEKVSFELTGDKKMFKHMSQQLEGVAMIRGMDEEIEVAQYGETRVTVYARRYGKSK